MFYLIDHPIHVYSNLTNAWLFKKNLTDWQVLFQLIRISFKTM